MSNPASYVNVPKNAPRKIVKRSLIYHTGMRVGKILGLTWDDVDIAGKKITVKRQVVYVEGPGNCLTAPKTPTNVREVLINDVLAVELSSWRARQFENKQQFNGRYIYRETNGHILYQSKALPLDGEHARLVCTRERGQDLQKKLLAKFLIWRRFYVAV